jgi:putative membrane protein
MYCNASCTPTNHFFRRKMMDKYIDLPGLLGATALALILGASPAIAQNASAAGNASDTTSSSGAGTSSSTGSAGASSSSDTAQSRSAGSQNGAQVAEQDREFMEDIAHANLAEIETGKMALEKSQDPQIKKFAQMMIDDHTKAMKELQSLAKKKEVDLPAETDLQHKTIATALKALSGNTFDEQYIARVGVGDHERTLELLKKTEQQTQDAQLKAYAANTLKSVSKHLEMAKKLEQKK